MEIDKMFVKFGTNNMASDIKGLLAPEDNPADWTEVPETLGGARRIIKDGATIRAATDKECDDEILALSIIGVGNRKRWERDLALQLSDKYMVSDYYAKLTDAQKTEITAYREALRNITTLPGWPLTFTFPPLPAFAAVATL